MPPSRSRRATGPGACSGTPLIRARLPGKVLLPIQGRPVLQYVLERVERCEGLDDVVVATSADASDDPIAPHVREPLHRPDDPGAVLDALEADASIPETDREAARQELVPLDLSSSVGGLPRQVVY